MFQIDPTTSAITMHRGDTGAYDVTLARSDGEPFTSVDRAVYTVMQGQTVKIHREYALDGETNGKFTIAFHNSDTDTWAATSYDTEIRVVINPVYDDNDKIINGDIVRTPPELKSTITILSVLEDI